MYYVNVTEYLNKCLNQGQGYSHDNHDWHFMLMITIQYDTRQSARNFFFDSSTSGFTNIIFYSPTEI